MMAEDNYRDLIGYRVGDYVIDDYLEAGGQAVVYTAHHYQFKRAYALKIFGLMQSGPEGLEIGLNEAKKLASVRHNAVVTFFPPGVDEVEIEGVTHRVLYLPMDYADRGNCDKNPPFKKDTHLSDR